MILFENIKQVERILGILGKRQKHRIKREHNHLCNEW